MKIFAFADEASKEVDGQIRAMLRNNLQGLEVRGVNGTNVSQITLEEAKLLRSKLDDKGLVTWSIGSPIGKIKIHEDFESHLDVFRHTLEVAQILGAQRLRLFSFYMPKGEDPAQYRNAVMDRMASFVEVAKGSGVLLCHENEKGIYGDVADRCLDLHKALPELGGIFDPANFVQCGEDTLRAWEMLKGFVNYLHIKDALADGSVVPAGCGMGNVPQIVRDFIARGGDACTMEPHLKVFDGLKALEEDGNTSVVGKYRYPSADAAFDAACNAMKAILKEV